jgi:hypothetical protein
MPSWRAQERLYLGEGYRILCIEVISVNTNCSITYIIKTAATIVIIIIIIIIITIIIIIICSTMFFLHYPIFLPIKKQEQKTLTVQLYKTTLQFGV